MTSLPELPAWDGARSWHSSPRRAGVPVPSLAQAPRALSPLHGLSAPGRGLWGLLVQTFGLLAVPCRAQTAEEPTLAPSLLLQLVSRPMQGSPEGSGPHRHTKLFRNKDTWFF